MPAKKIPRKYLISHELKELSRINFVTKNVSYKEYEIIVNTRASGAGFGNKKKNLDILNEFVKKYENHFDKEIFKTIQMVVDNSYYHFFL